MRRHCIVILTLLTLPFLLTGGCKGDGKKPGEGAAGKGPFKPQKLTTCHRYVLTDRKPVYFDRFDQGNVALYGVHLLAKRNDDAIAYLMKKQKKGLWEYQDGFGVTSLDTTMVLEGLDLYQDQADVVKKATAKIVQDYFDPVQGGFRTVNPNESNAPYWLDTGVLATAQIVYFVEKYFPKKHQQIIARSKEFIAKNQNPNGSWDGNWFASQMIPMYYALRALKTDEKKYGPQIKKALQFIKKKRKRGGWEDSVVESAFAIRSLALFESEAREINLSAALLIRKLRMNKTALRGEPVLAYWIEHPKNGRLFFTVPITAASPGLGGVGAYACSEEIRGGRFPE